MESVILTQGLYLVNFFCILSYKEKFFSKTTLNLQQNIKVLQ